MGAREARNTTSTSEIIRGTIKLATPKGKIRDTNGRTALITIIVGHAAEGKDIGREDTGSEGIAIIIHIIVDTRAGRR